MRSDTATATKEPEVEMSTTGRAALEIDPALVKVNSEGFAWRTLLVRLPQGVIADDLKDPAIWRRVQGSPRAALRQLDQLMIISFDQTWIAECIVAEADRRKAVLGKPRITSFADRFTPLLEDENYRTKWSGSGYFVERKSDGHRMTPDRAAPEHATHDLLALYPRQAA